MKFFNFVLLICLSGFLGFEYYQLSQPSMAASGSANPLRDTPFSYGNRYNQTQASLPQTEGSESRKSTVSDRLKKITKKELRKFKGLLDLPNDSFTYMVKQMNPEETDQLMSCGLILIQSYPKKARRYAYRLLVCHLVLNQNSADEEDTAVEAEESSDLPVPTPYKSVDFIDGVTATLSASALSFFNWFSWFKLVNIIWLILQTLYYTTTVVGCLLVALFISDQLRNRPFHNPVNASPSWPRVSNNFSTLTSTESDKTYPQALPL